MTPPDTSALAVELSNLRSDINGFRSDISAVGRDLSEIKTACAVLVARSDRTERDVRDLQKELDQVRTDLDAVKSRQWPLQSVAALGSATAIGLAVWQVVGR